MEGLRHGRGRAGPRRRGEVASLGHAPRGLRVDGDAAAEHHTRALHHLGRAGRRHLLRLRGRGIRSLPLRRGGGRGGAVCGHGVHRFRRERARAPAEPAESAARGHGRPGTSPTACARRAEAVPGHGPGRDDRNHRRCLRPGLVRCVRGRVAAMALPHRAGAERRRGEKRRWREGVPRDAAHRALCGAAASSGRAAAACGRCGVEPRCACAEAALTIMARKKNSWRCIRDHS
mmetsp:Transcript_19178/g.56473  ORF Transcript_19178/g.56473 Transcript_19178/m.56473 type:complete len:232 (+) Transcript_19178:498-1193(+)